jgi:hypothetical protein
LIVCALNSPAHLGDLIFPTEAKEEMQHEAGDVLRRRWA